MTGCFPKQRNGTILASHAVYMVVVFPGWLLGTSSWGKTPLPKFFRKIVVRIPSNNNNNDKYNSNNNNNNNNNDDDNDNDNDNDNNNNNNNNIIIINLLTCFNWLAFRTKYFR